MKNSIKAMVMSIIFIGSLICGGCATSKGRFALIDVDFRDADQIKASQFESLSNTNLPAQVTVAQEKGTFPFSLFFDLLKVVKCRIRIGSLEWVEKPVNPKIQ